MKRADKASSKSYRGLLLLALVLGLTACQEAADEPVPLPPPPPPPPPGTQPCDNDCELVVKLPADPNAPPTISESEFHVVQGVRVRFLLVDESDRPAQAATVLRFMSKDESAFQNRGGEPMEVVPLRLDPRQNVFTVRSFEDGACRIETGGCKYDIVNNGDPGRPELDPHVIIWESR